MSDYIERSKHPDMTRMVQDHFGVHGPASGANFKSVLPTRSGTPPINDGTGVNYTPPDQAGHYVK